MNLRTQGGCRLVDDFFFGGGSCKCLFRTHKKISDLKALSQCSSFFFFCFHVWKFNFIFIFYFIYLFIPPPTYGSSKFFHSWHNNQMYRKTVTQATCSRYKTVLQCPASSHVSAGAQYGPLWQHDTRPTCSKFHVTFVAAYPTELSWQHSIFCL